MRKPIRFIAVLAAVGALGLTTGIAVAGARNSFATSAVQGDDATHMQAALDALKTAEHHLSEVKGTAGGHLAPTVKATKDAIKHATEGLEALKK